MKLHTSLAALLACGLTLPAVTVSAQTPATQAVTYSTSQLDQELRLAKSHITEARKELDRSVNYVNANGMRTAVITLLRTEADLAKAEAILDPHPQHIELLENLLFRDEKKTRVELRKKYDVVDEEYASLENEFWTWVDEFDKKFGRLSNGKTLRQYMNELDTARQILANPNSSQQQRDAAANTLATAQRAIDTGDDKALSNPTGTSTTGGGNTTTTTTGGNTSIPANDPRFNPNSPGYDPLKDPRFDPNSQYYDPNFEPSNYPGYDPRRDPRRDPNSPRYIPGFTPSGPYANGGSGNTMGGGNSGSGSAGNTGGGRTTPPYSLSGVSTADVLERPCVVFANLPYGDSWVESRTSDGQTIKARKKKDCKEQRDGSQVCGDKVEILMPNQDKVVFHDYQPVNTSSGEIEKTEVLHTTLPDGSYKVQTTKKLFNPSTNAYRVLTQEGAYSAEGKAKRGTSPEKWTEEVAQEASPQLDPRKNCDISLAGRNTRISILGIDPETGKEIERVLLREGETTEDVWGDYYGNDRKILVAEGKTIVSVKKVGGQRQVVEEPGQAREWKFIVQPVDGSDTYEGSNFTAQFAFGDELGKSNFRIQGWEVRSPSGRSIATFGAEQVVTVTFTEGGRHSFIVRGETDWGSPFEITIPFTIDL